MRIDSQTTMPPSERMATPVVPPPMSTTMLPCASATGSPAPIAAAIGSAMRLTWRAPAASVASSTASRSTAVIPLGTHSTTRANGRPPPFTRRMKYRSISAVTSKSAMTPCRSGRIARIDAGVRPIIRRASSPTAWTSPVRSSTATTDGSKTTIPSPRTKTSEFAVPRSTASSRPVNERRCATETPRQASCDSRQLSAGRPEESGRPGFASERCALTGLLTGHRVRAALRVADLWRRRVARAVQAAVDRVRHVLVPVGVDEHVVVQVDAAVDRVADEAHPEAVVALHRHGSVDPAVLDRVPGDVERTAEGAGSAVDVDAAVDRREVDLHRRG